MMIAEWNESVHVVMGVAVKVCNCKEKSVKGVFRVKDVLYS